MKTEEEIKQYLYEVLSEINEKEKGISAVAMVIASTLNWVLEN